MPDRYKKFLNPRVTQRLADQAKAQRLFEKREANRIHNEKFEAKEAARKAKQEEQYDPDGVYPI